MKEFYGKATLVYSWLWKITREEMDGCVACLMKEMLHPADTQEGEKKKSEMGYV